jgi:hypothetical protein
MKRVSVVGTVHEEKGLANVSALLAILERIEPEVIFLEIPCAAFDDYLSGSRRNLESTTVRQYRLTHHVDMVPVDLPTPDDDFFRNDRELHKRIERRSPEYRRLVDWHGQYVSAYGFVYLNSEYCSTLFAELHEAILTAIAELGDRQLDDLYELSNRTSELRDKAMVASIENYWSQTSFSNGAFLVGASAVDKRHCTAHSGGDSFSLQWDFAGFLETPHRERGE